MTIALLLLLSAAGVLYAQSVSGTLTIGKDQFEMKYAAAARVKAGTRIVIADKPIPEDLLDDEAEIWDLKTRGYHGMQVDITPDKANYSLFVISETLQGSVTHSGTLDAKRLTVFTDKQVEGTLDAAPEEIGGNTVGYRVKFAAGVAPPEPAPTAADQTAAAGKAYLALVAAIRAGDKQKILEMAPPDRRAAIDTPQFPEMLKMVQQMTPVNIVVLKATENGDHAKLLARGSVDGAGQRGKIYLNRLNGKWVMARESWSAE